MIRKFAKHKLGMTGLVLASILVATAILAPVIAPYPPSQQSLRNRLQPPGTPGHVLGTDELGRDILSRVIWGARISLSVGIIAVAVGAVIGVPLGLIAAMSRRADSWILGLMDLMLAFPGILLALLIVAVLGVGIVNVTIAIGIYGIPMFTRLARAAAIVVREQEYVAAARAIGVSDAMIVVRHVLPNCMSPLVVQGTFRLATAILITAMLSFLGLGAQPPSPEWGTMLSTGRVYTMLSPHVMVFPGIAIFVTVLAFNLIGDGLRDVLDPRDAGT